MMAKVARVGAWVLLVVAAYVCLLAAVGPVLIANAATVVTCVGAVVFCAVYLGRAWRTSTIGINVMVLMAVIAIEAGLAVLTLVFGHDWPFRNYVRAVAWTIIAAPVVWRVALLWRAPRRRPFVPAAPPESRPPEPVLPEPVAADRPVDPR